MRSIIIIHCIKEQGVEMDTSEEERHMSILKPVTKLNPDCCFI